MERKKQTGWVGGYRPFLRSSPFAMSIRRVLSDFSPSDNASIELMASSRVGSIFRSNFGATENSSILRSARRISSLRWAARRTSGVLSFFHALGAHKICRVAELGRVFINLEAEEGLSFKRKNLREGVVPSALQASSIAFDKLLILKGSYYK